MAKARFDIKSVQDEAVKSVQRVYQAGVGVTDLAVKTVRETAADAQKRLVEFDAKATRANLFTFFQRFLHAEDATPGPVPLIRRERRTAL